jgi:H+-transporting ATP synthase F0 complex subunit s
MLTCFSAGGLVHLKKLTLHKCNYLDNEALPMLAAVKGSLEELQLSSCGDISDSAIKSLSCLSNLRHLLLYDLPEVTNREGCIEFLHSALPKCDIEFPYARVSELKTDKE